ncbi:MAG: hypothetical protein ACFB0B_09280 [Thermonemataceae bacterium]
MINEPIKIIKQAIRQTIDEGKVIVASWDAGGDQTLCNIRVDNVYNDFYVKDLDIGQALKDVIIDTLSLPNASEDQHVGDGQVGIDTKGAVTLTYNNAYYTPYSTDVDIDMEDYNAEEISIPYEDIHGFTQFIPRIRLSFSASYSVSHIIYAPRPVSIRTNLRIIEGDQVAFDEEALTHLKNWIREKTQIYFEDLKGIPTDVTPFEKGNKQVLNFIDIHGVLTLESQLRFSVGKHYDFVTYTKNRTVVIIE